MLYVDPHKYPPFNYRTDPALLKRVEKVATKLGIKSVTKALDQAVEYWLHNVEKEDSAWKP